jgi:hypothetical protein
MLTDSSPSEMYMRSRTSVWITRHYSIFRKRLSCPMLHRWHLLTRGGRDKAISGIHPEQWRQPLFAPNILNFPVFSDACEIGCYKQTIFFHEELTNKYSHRKTDTYTSKGSCSLEQSTKRWMVQGHKQKVSLNESNKKEGRGQGKMRRRN